MNYKWHYDRLIESRKNRELKEGVYYETHHIIPRSLGGLNIKENLVKLTAREHFIAHWLLWRIHKTKEMGFAFYMMQKFYNKNIQRQIFSSIAYQEAKEAKRKLIGLNNTKYKKGVPISDEQKEKQRKSMLGFKHTDESKAKRSIALTGRVFTEEHRKNLSKSLSEKTYNFSEERNKNISMKNSGENNGGAKKVYKKLNGVVIETFGTMKFALEHANSISPNIIAKNTFHRKILKKQILLGFTWEYDC